jgi:integrase
LANIVQTWIDLVAYSHSKNKSTAYQYKIHLDQFCKFIGKTPEQIIMEYQNTNDERQLRRIYASYLKAFIAKSAGQGLTTNTINSIVTPVKSFFKYNDLSIAFIPKSSGRVVYHNRDIARDEVRQILGASKPRDKAFFSMMAQSGLRPDTLCKLQLRDLEPDFSNNVVPCKINIPEEKAKGQYRPYFTFIGEESVKYLKAYLNGERPGVTSDDFLFTAYGLKKAASPKTLSVTFATLIRQLQASKVLDYRRSAKGKPSELRLYTLRKFFRKYARPAGWEFVQFWMGHIVHAGVDENYRPDDAEFHRALYREKAMPGLQFEKAAVDETEKIIAEQNKRIDSLQHELNVMKKFMRGEELSKDELRDIETT